MTCALGNPYFKCHPDRVHFVDQAIASAPGSYQCLCGEWTVRVEHPSKRSKALLDIVGWSKQTAPAAHVGDSK